MNDKNISLKTIEEKIRDELTVEITALLLDRLGDLIGSDSELYEELGIDTNIRIYFFTKNYELTELAAKGSEMAKKIINLRNKRENDAVQNAIEALQKLINKEKGKDLDTLNSDLNRLRDLIPAETIEEKSLTNRQLTSAEMEAYRQNREAADEKELDLLKDIVRQEWND